MPQPIIMHTDGLCRSASLASTLPATDQLISIDLPVGQGSLAKNLPTDVRTIQAALNRIAPLQGGPSIPLVVDGLCGPKTKAAIVQLQRVQFKGKAPDGLIEPGKRTLQRINQLLFSLPSDPSINDEIRARVVTHMNLVRRSIHAAQANLLLAVAPTGGLDLGQSLANDRLNRHFALNKLAQPAREQATRDITSVFNMYASALLMPGALGAGAFEADPTGDPRIAFAFPNGFFREGERDDSRDIPVNRIFLGRRAFFAIQDPDLCAFIMLHEMGHFVGFPGGSVIADHGRGWFTDSTISGLSTSQRLHNADCYATFAVECRTSSSQKPPYVQASTTSR